MRWNRIAGAAVALALTCGMAQAQAPSWSKEQTDVWTFVAKSWEDEAAQNGRWPGEYVHDRVVAWDDGYPAPRGKDSMLKWTRFNEKSSKMLQYEVSPLAISIVGDTAVVHYGIVTVTQRGQEKPEREVGAAVETLVRTGGQWKFLSLSGFDLEKK